MRRYALALAALLLVGLGVAVAFRGGDSQPTAAPPEVAAAAEAPTPPAAPAPAAVRPIAVATTQTAAAAAVPTSPTVPRLGVDSDAEAPPDLLPAPSTGAATTAVAQPSLASVQPGQDDPSEALPRPSGPTVNLTPTGRCSVSLNQALLARDVDRRDRQPMGVADAFPANGQPVYLFLDVNNGAGPDRDLRIRWEHDASGHIFEQVMPAGSSPSWHTWVYHLIQPGLTGSWRVKVYDPRGCQVGEASFEAR